MKATVIKYLRQCRDRRTAAEAALSATGVKTVSRAASALYSNRVSFIRRAARKVGFGGKISVKPEELQRFSSIQAARTGAVLARHPSRPMLDPLGLLPGTLSVLHNRNS
jgi:H+-transporting ATPase